MRKALEQIEIDAKKMLEKVSDGKELEDLRVRYLGKKGELTAILKNMGSLSAEERPAKAGCTSGHLTENESEVLSDAPSLNRVCCRDYRSELL